MGISHPAHGEPKGITDVYWELHDDYACRVLPLQQHPCALLPGSSGVGVPPEGSEPPCMCASSVSAAADGQLPGCAVLVTWGVPGLASYHHKLTQSSDSGDAHGRWC